MSILRGIIRIARFRADGLAQFGDTIQAMSSSLAPLVAFPLVGALLEIGQGNWVIAVSDLLASLVALLAPLVISETLARFWGVRAAWMRYAVASNWAQWAMPMALLALLAALFVMGRVGVAVTPAVIGAGAIGVVLYGVALHWFLARAALGLSRLRAVLMVLACDVTTVLLVLGPRLLALHLGAPGG